jgi:hypothetical protein
MRTTSSLREWVFALGIVAVFSAAALYLIGDRVSVSTGSIATSGGRFGRPEAQDSSGTIVMCEHGQCRQIRFDKATGTIEDNSLGPCPVGKAFGAASTEGRMQSIRQSFSGR